MQEISIPAEKIFEVLGFSITNTFLLSLILSFGIFSLCFISFRRAKMIPSGIQNFFETILDSLLNFIDSITGSRDRTKEVFPIAATLFVLILFSNLIELIPGVGVFHFLRSPSSDLNFTVALALFSVTYINILAFKKLGFFSYSKKFFNKNPILLFVGVLEGISELSRIFSLAIRLFGNLFAGEVLLIVTSFLFAYVLPLPFLLLEILVGFIQAFIFSSLIVIFYTTSIQIAHHD
ncbi:MAG: F0F1 ATP synthase subunit A [Candidatus Wildermuthbacteria bacterium]|nr:F0F1 ATP synthase subunit A [Candidatus Wildermuthbacteria bacterium]